MAQAEKSLTHLADNNRSQNLISSIFGISDKTDAYYAALAQDLISSLNGASDSQGDESANFTATITRGSISEGELQALRSENDQGTLLIDGKIIAIEFAEAPTITSPGNLSGNEDTFGISLFGADAVSAPDSSTMEAKVSITGDGGTLSTGAVQGAILAQQGARTSINSFLDSLVFVPDANWSGTVKVIPVNDAPLGADKTISINEDASIKLTLAAFGLFRKAMGVLVR